MECSASSKSEAVKLRKDESESSKLFTSIIILVHPLRSMKPYMFNLVRSFLLHKCIGRIQQIYQKTLTKYIFWKFLYVFINAGVGWNFNILNVICQITFLACTLNDMDL